MAGDSRTRTSRTTATGSREVPEPRAAVWRALAVLEPYCAVCDVSYVLGDPRGGPGVGTTFVCAPGRLGGSAPASGAPRGEIVAWEPEVSVTTRLELTPETWTTRIELADSPSGGTRVTLTITNETRAKGVLARLVHGRAARPMVARTVESELDKVPAHVERAASPT